MKRKIGQLYNKPIVIGNPNEVTKNEIHVNEFSVPQGGGGVVDSSSKNFIQYFKVPKGWNNATYARMYSVILKADDGGNSVIYPTSMVNNAIDSKIVAYGIMPNLPISAPDAPAKNLKEHVSRFYSTLFTQTEITEEEFYTL